MKVNFLKPKGRLVRIIRYFCINTESRIDEMMYSFGPRIEILWKKTIYEKI
jgi:hypothetical protein